MASWRIQRSRFSRYGPLAVNHSPKFASVIHPTLRTGVEALVVAIAREALAIESTYWNPVLVGAAVCFGVRVLALKYGCRLPIARSDD